jgi:O-antigen ligase
MSITFFVTVSLFAVIFSELLSRNSKLLEWSLWAVFVSTIINAIPVYFSETGIFPLALRSLDKWGGSLFLGNSSFLGSLLVTGLFLGIYLFSVSKNKIGKGLIALGCAVIAFCPTIFHTALVACEKALSWIMKNPFDLLGDANGATIGLCVGLVASLFVYLSHSPRKKVALAGTLCVVLLVAGSLYTSARFINPESKLHQTFVESKTSNRFLFWEIARKSGNERPLLGYGYNNYIDLYQNNFDGTVFTSGYTPEKWVDRPHNTVFEYFALTGYTGLIAYLTLFALILVGLYQIDIPGARNRLLSSLLIGAALAYFIQSLFVFDTNTILLLLFLLIAFAFGGYKSPDYLSVIDSKLCSRKWFIVSLGILSVVALIPLVMLPIRESRAWYKVARKINISEYPRVRPGIEQMSLVGTSEDSSYAATILANNIIGSINKMNERNEKYFTATLTTTIDALNLELKKDPNDFRLNYITGRVAHVLFLINRNHQNLLAENKELLVTSNKLLLNASSLNPYNPDPYLENAQVYLLMSEGSNAQRQVLRALEIAPNYVKEYDVYQIAEHVLDKYPDAKVAATVNEKKKEFTIFKNLALKQPLVCLKFKDK